MDASSIIDAGNRVIKMQRSVPSMFLPERTAALN